MGGERINLVRPMWVMWILGFLCGICTASVIYNLWRN
jgi:hypothetical protein